MIIKILGTLDIISALIFWLTIFGFIPQIFILAIGLYLLVKGAFFLISADIASIIDIICSFVIFASINFHIPVFITIIISIYLLQKGAFSLLN